MYIEREEWGLYQKVGDEKGIEQTILARKYDARSDLGNKSVDWRTIGIPMEILRKQNVSSRLHYTVSRCPDVATLWLLQ
jgi:hypothetical protein